MKDKMIADLLGEPFSLSEKGIRLEKKIWDCECEIANTWLEHFNSKLRYINGKLTILKDK